MSRWILDSEGRPQVGWRLAICLVAFLMAQVAVSILAVGALFAVAHFRGMEGGALMADAVDGGEGARLLQGLAAVPALLATVAVVWGCRRFLDRRPFAALGLSAPSRGWGNTLALGLGPPVVVLGGLLGALVVLGIYRVTGLTTSWETWVFLVLLFFAAFSEELLARGYLLQNLMEGSGPAFAVVVSSALFWLLHAFNPSVWSSFLAPLNLFGAGVVLALAYLAAGDLWLPTVLHYGWNVTEGLVFQLPVSGVAMDGVVDLQASPSAPEWLTGGSFGFEGSVFATLAEVLLALFFYVLWRQRAATGSDPGQVVPADPAPVDGMGPPGAS